MLSLFRQRRSKFLLAMLLLVQCIVATADNLPALLHIGTSDHHTTLQTALCQADCEAPTMTSAHTNTTDCDRCDACHGHGSLLTLISTVMHFPYTSWSLLRPFTTVTFASQPLTTLYRPPAA